jgi:hypothetical protein
MRYGEISFDTSVEDAGQNHVEGCFRLEDEAWRVFHLTHRHAGVWWNEQPIVKADAIFQSGISGVNAVYPQSVILNRANSMSLMSKILGGVTWTEVRGPDSLQLK